MAAPFNNKPRLGARLNFTHPATKGLRYALVLNETSGQAAFDAVLGKQATFIGSPAWSSPGGEPVVRVVAGSSQYLDGGDLELLDGATALTVIACMSRSSTSNAVHVQKGSSANSRVGLTLNNDGNAYFYVNNGTAALGSVASSITGKHVHALRFDGSQSTNATRVRGFIDGVEQTLSYGATTPTTGPSTSASLRIGSLESSGAFSTGDFYFVFVYDRALSPERIKAISEDPYAMFAFGDEDEYATIPQSVVGGLPELKFEALTASLSTGGDLAPAYGELKFEALPASLTAGEVFLDPNVLAFEFDPLSGGVTGGAVGVTFQNFDPEDGAYAVRVPDLFSFDVVSADLGDPISSTTIGVTVNGVAVPSGNLTKTSILNGYHVVVSWPITDDEHYTVDVEAATASTVGFPAFDSWDFDTAVSVAELVIEEGSIGIVAPYGITMAGGVLEFADERLAFDGAVFDYPRLGSDYHLAIEGAVAPEVGFHQSETVTCQGWISLYIQQFVPIALITGEHLVDLLGVALDLESNRAAHRGAGVATVITSTKVNKGAQLAVDVSIEERQSVPVAAIVGEAVEASVSLAIDVEGRSTTGLIVVDSPSLEWIEEDDDQ